ncbi:MAG: hypothetical protein Q4C96_00700 [Planctomycetia bacterium]|nr:hypothetical protein [Planctomycetia bacterium]
MAKKDKKNYWDFLVESLGTSENQENNISPADNIPEDSQKNTDSVFTQDQNISFETEIKSEEIFVAETVVPVTEILSQKPQDVTSDTKLEETSLKSEVVQEETSLDLLDWGKPPREFEKFVHLHGISTDSSQLPQNTDSSEYAEQLVYAQHTLIQENDSNNDEQIQNDINVSTDLSGKVPPENTLRFIGKIPPIKRPKGGFGAGLLEEFEASSPENEEEENGNMEEIAGTEKCEISEECENHITTPAEDLPEMDSWAKLALDLGVEVVMPPAPPARPVGTSQSEKIPVSATKKTQTIISTPEKKQNRPDTSAKRPDEKTGKVKREADHISVSTRNDFSYSEKNETEEISSARQNRSNKQDITSKSHKSMKKEFSPEKEDDYSFLQKSDLSGETSKKSQSERNDKKRRKDKTESRKTDSRTSETQPPVFPEANSRQKSGKDRRSEKEKESARSVVGDIIRDVVADKMLSETGSRKRRKHSERSERNVKELYLTEPTSPSDYDIRISQQRMRELFPDANFDEELLEDACTGFVEEEIFEKEDTRAPSLGRRRSRRNRKNIHADPVSSYADDEMEEEDFWEEIPIHEEDVPEIPSRRDGKSKRSFQTEKFSEKFIIKDDSEMNETSSRSRKHKKGKMASEDYVSEESDFSDSPYENESPGKRSRKHRKNKKIVNNNDILDVSSSEWDEEEEHFEEEFTPPAPPSSKRSRRGKVPLTSRDAYYYENLQEDYEDEEYQDEDFPSKEDVFEEEYEDEEDITSSIPQQYIPTWKDTVDLIVSKNMTGRNTPSKNNTKKRRR